MIDSTTLAALADFPPRLEAFYSAIPAAYRNWRPDSWDGIPSEPFTAIEQICHVRDVELDGYHERFRRALTESHPRLANLDGERLAHERSYGTADGTTVFDELGRARAMTLAMIAGFNEAQLERTAEFDGVTVTLRGLVHLLCSHDQQHLAGLQWLAARIDGSRHAGRQI
jgi:hypothetical protein